ncbi:hypothetical protein GCM10008907_09950 [Clostridium sartagoforme]
MINLVHKLFSANFFLVHSAQGKGSREYVSGKNACRGVHNPRNINFKNHYVQGVKLYI